MQEVGSSRSYCCSGITSGYDCSGYGINANLTITCSDSTAGPTIEPTKHPTIEPTINPTIDPTLTPTNNPTHEPTLYPTFNPSTIPTNAPTIEPTVKTLNPTYYPTTSLPTTFPTCNPTWNPTHVPTHIPTDVPTTDPTNVPTIPTFEPTITPTNEPTIPTFEPTVEPTTSITTRITSVTDDSDELQRIPQSHFSTSLEQTILIILIVCILLLCMCGMIYCIMYGKKEEQIKQMQTQIELITMKASNDAIQNQNQNLQYVAVGDYGHKNRLKPVTESTVVEAGPSWKSKKMKNWENEEIVDWVKCMNLDVKLNEKILNVIKMNGCIGQDIIELKSLQDVGESFGIVDNELLCKRIL
eukprot:345708_1